MAASNKNSMSSKPQSVGSSSPTNKTPLPPNTAILDESDDEDDLPVTSAQNENEKLSIRLVEWNLQGNEDLPHPKDFMAISYPTEANCIHAYALQEVKCLEKLRDALWTSIGGKEKFELFEHWMGKSGPGFAGQTALLVFAPKELCITGRFRLSRYANAQVKREVLRGTRFKLLGGATSSRGAVGMPFSFLDTTFTLVSVRLLEEESEKSLDTQQKDLEKILELCRMSDNAEFSAIGNLHHAFVCGSFGMGSTKQASSTGEKNSTLGSTGPRRSISSRFSFQRKTTGHKLSTLSSSNSRSASLVQSESFSQIKQKFPSLDEYEEQDSTTLAFEPDHIFYKCASPQLSKCLEPISSALLTSVVCGRPPLSTLFKLRGKGSELLTSWSRLTGNLPIHLSSRSNYVHARNDVAQRPRISTAPNLRKERESRVSLDDLSTRKMSNVNEEKYVLECTKCEGPISDSEMIVPVTKDGNAYHARCFCCDHCGVPLCGDTTKLAPGQAPSDVPFHEVEGKLLCQKSFETLYIKCCEACGGALGDEFLTLPSHTPNGEEKRFHISCFKCGICSRPFATRIMMGDLVIEAAIPHEGMYLCEMDFDHAVGGVKCCVCDHSFSKGIKINGDIYCQRDFQEVFSGGICAVCNTPVQDDEALTLSSTDPSNKRACHMSCLKCSVCAKKLHEINESFVEFEGQTYCKEDWEKKRATQVYPNCAKCLLPIKDNVVDALDKKWHPKCFTCSFCETSLIGAKFYVNDGMPWCLNDFERFCSPDLPACASCHRTVGSADAPKAQHFEGRTWHGPCYACAKCGKSMVGRKPRVHKGKVCCADSC